MPKTDEEIFNGIDSEYSRAGNSEGRKDEIIKYLKKMRSTDHPIATIDEVHLKMSFSHTKRQNTYSAIMELIREGRILGRKNGNGHWMVFYPEGSKK